LSNLKKNGKRNKLIYLRDLKQACMKLQELLLIWETQLSQDIIWLGSNKMMKNGQNMMMIQCISNHLKKYCNSEEGNLTWKLPTCFCSEKYTQDQFSNDFDKINLSIFQI